MFICSLEYMCEIYESECFPYKVYYPTDFEGPNMLRMRTFAMLNQFDFYRNTYIIENYLGNNQSQSNGDYMKQLLYKTKDLSILVFPGCSYVRYPRLRLNWRG